MDIIKAEKMKCMCIRVTCEGVKRKNYKVQTGSTLILPDLEMQVTPKHNYNLSVPL